MVGCLQQGQSVGTQRWREQDGEPDWAEAGKHSFVVGALHVVGHIEQSCHDYTVGSAAACLDFGQGASGASHPWTIGPLPGFLEKKMHTRH